MLSVLLMSLAAHAVDCDAKALSSEIADASPIQAARLFSDLASCDKVAAAKIAPETVSRFLSGEEANAAVVSAIQVGAHEPVVGWIDGLQSDERAGVIKALGQACAASVPVQEFFVGRAASMGEDFWKQRWYRALATCPVPSVQAVLDAELDKGFDKDRSRAFGVLESYARAGGVMAVPKLKKLAVDNPDGEVQSQIVSAFADAAHVGAETGIDDATASAAVAAIQEIAPSLEVKAVEQARITLIALGDEQASDALAAVRFKDVRQDDGSFLWGGIALENATCKNGKKKQRATVAKVYDLGQTWPDQLNGKVDAAAHVTWSLTLADGCKGEGTVTVVVPEEPFADAAGFNKWVDGWMKDARDPTVKKIVRVDVEDLRI